MPPLIRPVRISRKAKVSPSPGVFHDPAAVLVDFRVN